MASRKTKAAVKRTTTRVRKVTPARAKTPSVILQARVEGRFAEELLTHDAAVLGLDGPSEVVREGLRLVHRRAQEQALIESYDTFYGGRRAPLPAGVVDEGSD
jgi:hypothetical protein